MLQFGVPRRTFRRLTNRRTSRNESAPYIRLENRNMREQANLLLVRELYHAFSRGDVAAVLSFLDPQADLEFEGPPSIPWAGRWHGREGWTQFFQTLAAAAGEITLQMEPFAAQGGNVVTAGRYQAHVKATGKQIDSPLVHLGPFAMAWW